MARHRTGLRYRKVPPLVWLATAFRGLSEKAKYLYLFFLTGPHTTSLPGF